MAAETATTRSGAHERAGEGDRGAVGGEAREGASRWADKMGGRCRAGEVSVCAESKKLASQPTRSRRLEQRTGGFRALGGSGGTVRRWTNVNQFNQFSAGGLGSTLR